MPIASIEKALEEIKAGRMIILVDDEDRENEGDLTMAAEMITPEAINFMAKYGRGLICLSMTQEWADHLRLPLMVRENLSRFGTAFTVSIEARKGVSTGISAADRATTILAAVNPKADYDDIVSPGHIFPLRAKNGGVLVRAGQTEGSVDMARLAGLKAAGVICEIMNDDGTMARLPDLEKFAEEHGLVIASVADLIAYRMKHERLVHRAATVHLPTKYGDFTGIAYTNDVDDYVHLAMVKGEIKPGDNILVRVHSECLTGDALGSLKCDCGDQLQTALKMIECEGKGVLLYLHQEGRGIGLLNKLKAYELQEQGQDTVEANINLGFEADRRDYGIGAQILADLGIHKMRLMTNNPQKMIGLDGYALSVTERVPIEIPPNPININYMRTKCDKMGHILNID